MIAHETGHIQGSHLVQMREQISQSMVPYLLEMLATIGGAAAGGRSGNPNDWGGVMGGGIAALEDHLVGFVGPHFRTAR